MCEAYNKGYLKERRNEDGHEGEIHIEMGDTISLIEGEEINYIFKF